MAEDETASEQPKANPPAGASEDATGDRGTFLPLIFGGAVAAALGFFGSQIDSVERALGLAPPDNGLEEVVATQADRIATQAEEIAGQAKQIAALTEQMENLPEPPPAPDLSGIESQLSDQSARVEKLVQRVDEVEKRPMTESVSDDAVAAYEDELARLQASVTKQREELQAAVAEQRQEIETILAEARDSESDAERQAQVALARAAAARVITAVDNGAPFGEDLATLQDAAEVTVPETLSAFASDGVATLGSLQSSFPSAAREALSAARRDAAAGEGGIGAFLERQLGARSVTPQAGDDPDAVLSRAEAAVMQGRLGEALTELETLPDAARDAMGDWISQARTRYDAITAAQELMSALGTN